jgi:hypothetical protein
MNPRFRAILIAVGAVILIALAAWLLFFRSAPPAVVPEPEPEPQPSGGLTTSGAATVVTSIPDNPLITEPAAPAEIDERLAARQNAEIFAERYGSWSNQGDYQNLRDVLPFMTARFRAETEAFIAEREGQAPPTAYEGVTSILLSTTFESYDASAGKAEAVVRVQQTKSVGSSETVGHAALSVTLEKVGTEWKVDSAIWSEIP